MVLNDDEVVKSVERVFVILRWFDDVREPAGATAISRDLGLPLSSTLALLSSISAKGYLSFDPATHTFFPSLKAARLGGSCATNSQGANLRQLLNEVAAETGAVASLSCQSDLEMLIVDLQRGLNAITTDLEAGDGIPLFGSVIGFTALSRLPDKDVLRLAGRYNRRIRSASAKVEPIEVLRTVRAIRARGYGLGFGLMTPEVAALAWSLPVRPNAHPLVLSVGVDCQHARVSERHLAMAVRPILARYINH